VVVFVPIAFSAPAVFMFIPPAMLLGPAAFPGLVQLTTFMLGFAAVASMATDGLVVLMLRVLDTPLAAIDIIRVKARGAEEN